MDCIIDKTYMFSKRLGYILSLYEWSIYRSGRHADQVYPDTQDQLMEEIVVVNGSMYWATQRRTSEQNFYVDVFLIEKERKGPNGNAIRKFGHVKPEDKSKLEEMLRSIQLQGEVRFG